MNTQQLSQQLVDAITFPYSRDEKLAMVQWLLESRLGLSRSQILSGSITTAVFAHFASDLQRINRGEPLQYILGHAEFRGRQFDVSPAVLIPRPETELLIDIALETLKSVERPRIWDIGTGSGCIAVTLSLELNKAQAFGSDSSAEALEVARRNATRLQADVQFEEHNILTNAVNLNDLHAIVSNPPYIRRFEQSVMSSTVLRFEPQEALFVPDEDPLLFHRVIAEKSRNALNPGGLLLLEINEALGAETAAMATASGYLDVILHRDLDGKTRFVSGVAPH